MTLKIELTEYDFQQVASEFEESELFGTVEILGEDTNERTTEQIIEELLPKALVNRVSKIMPADFVVSELEINVEVSGKVFGSGISGSFSMKLSKANL